MKSLKAIALICTLGLVTGAAMAKGNFCDRMLRGLDLTEAQQTQIETLKTAHKAEMEAGKEERQATRDAHKEQMKALILADTIDVEAVKALKASAKEQRAAHAEQKLEHRMSILQVLTPEQREVVLERMAKKKGKKCGKKGKGGKNQQD